MGAGPRDVGMTGGSDAKGAASHPFEKGLLLQKREASHMCKTHLVKINTGFVFSIKNKNQKTNNCFLK